MKSKVALVTGATGELGRVITRTLTDCGARVSNRPSSISRSTCNLNASLYLIDDRIRTCLSFAGVNLFQDGTRTVMA